MILTEGKKLHVFFGSLNIPEKNEEMIETEECGDIEEEYLEWEKIFSERTDIIEKLNKNSEVCEVSDLFINLPEDVEVNPILFKIHIPFSLQKKKKYGRDSNRANVEDFYVLFDGILLIVYAVSDLEKIPYGVWDVRDRVLKIFNTFGKAKIIPPTFRHNHFTFTVNGKSDESFNINTPVSKPIEVKKLVRELYEDTWLDLYVFYRTAQFANEISELGWKIENYAGKLLSYFNKLLKASGINVIKKWKIINKMKKEMAKIIELIAKYRSNEIILKRNIEDLSKLVISEKNQSSKFLQLSYWEEYTCPNSFLDVDSLFKSVEHVRREIEAFSFNTSAIVSALIGAILGSMITLVLSNLPL